MIPNDAICQVCEERPARVQLANDQGEVIDYCYAESCVEEMRRDVERMAGSGL